MKPGARSADTLSPTQLELTKSMIEATARITAAMVTVSAEKNPAKISEAFRTIYKTVAEATRSVG